MNEPSFFRLWAQRFETLFAWLSACWLGLAMFWLYQATTQQGAINFFVAIYLLLTVVCSVMAFFAHLWDKRLAVRNKPRFSEKTLHGLSLAGGWPGTMLARKLFRHKTQKMSYRLVFWLIVILHVAALGYAVYLTFFAPVATTTAPAASLFRSVPVVESSDPSTAGVS